MSYCVSLSTGASMTLLPAPKMTSRKNHPSTRHMSTNRTARRSYLPIVLVSLLGADAVSADGLVCVDGCCAEERLAAFAVDGIGFPRKIHAYLQFAGFERLTAILQMVSTTL